MNQYNQYKCTSSNCNYSSNELVTIIDHINVTHTFGPIFNFECVNRLPKKCHYKYLSFEGLVKHLKQCHPKQYCLALKKKIKCDLCETAPSTIKELKSHYLSHWRLDREPVKCIFRDCKYKTTINEKDIQKIKNNYWRHCSVNHPAGFQSESMRN